MTNPVQIPDAAVQSALDIPVSGNRENYIRSILTAALPHLQLGYEVKKLEWDKNSEKEEWYGGAQNELVGINEYNIFAHPCATGLFVLDVMGNRCEEDFTSVETAKAAAQSDFERRVRECVVDGSNAQGWLYFNEDTGTEYSADHPVISGECPDAQDIKPATNENLLHELLSSWKAWAEDRQEIADLRDEIATKPVDVAAVREQCAQIAKSWEETAINLGQHVEASIANDIKLSIRALSAEPALKGQQHDK